MGAATPTLMPTIPTSIPEEYSRADLPLLVTMDVALPQGERFIRLIAFIQRFDANHRKNRPENFLFSDGHVRLDVVENRGAQEESAAFRFVLAAVAQRLCPFGHTPFGVTDDALAMIRGD